MSDNKSLAGHYPSKKLSDKLTLILDRGDTYLEYKEGEDLYSFDVDEGFFSWKLYLHKRNGFDCYKNSQRHKLSEEEFINIFSHINNIIENKRIFYFGPKYKLIVDINTFCKFVSPDLPDEKPSF